jgi:hypothetical protein
MSKVIFIDATKREISLVELKTSDWTALRTLVGGYIQAAYGWPSGDVLFVDEEGLLKAPDKFFRITVRPDQPLAGNGVIVGLEINDTDGDYMGNADVALTVEQVADMVEFRSPEQVSSWAKANASEPASTIYSFNPDGTVEKAVLARTGEVFGQFDPAKKQP